MLQTSYASTLLLNTEPNTPQPSQTPHTQTPHHTNTTSHKHHITQTPHTHKHHTHRHRENDTSQNTTTRMTLPLEQVKIHHSIMYFAKQVSETASANIRLTIVHNWYDQQNSWEMYRYLCIIVMYIHINLSWTTFSSRYNTWTKEKGKMSF